LKPTSKQTKDEKQNKTFKEQSKTRKTLKGNKQAIEQKPSQKQNKQTSNRKRCRWSCFFVPCVFLRQF